jgi:predicted CxxxxCH...CXXCH cytochrome family protein
MVPGSVYSLGHVDSDAPAELLFSGSLADIDPTSPFGQPAYEYSSTTCANTFCHGAWSLSKVSSPYPDAYTADEMFGDNFSPLWTGGEDQVDCGTCHGLPPAGHVPAELATCGDSGCHSGVVAPDGTIDDLSLHMNGKVNVNDTERPF